jgi:hypothetical protein
MKTYDFAYWVNSLSTIREDQVPTDRFPIKAPTILHAFNEGVAIATKNIVSMEQDYPKIEFAPSTISKVTIIEL